MEIKIFRPLTIAILVGIAVTLLSLFIFVSRLGGAEESIGKEIIEIKYAVEAKTILAKIALALNGDYEKIVWKEQYNEGKRLLKISNKSKNLLILSNPEGESSLRGAELSKENAALLLLFLDFVRNPNDAPDGQQEQEFVFFDTQSQKIIKLETVLRSPEFNRIVGKVYESDKIKVKFRLDVARIGNEAHIVGAEVQFKKLGAWSTFFLKIDEFKKEAIK